jgi:transcriptional regulator with XRE-family HTH domain
MVYHSENFISRIISRNVVRLREERGWSQVDLAEKYGCTFQYISQMETGHRGFGKTTLKKLLAVFGVTEGELVEMPKGFVSDEMEVLWKKFCMIETGENRKLLEEVISIVNDAPPEGVKSLAGFVELLKKNIKKE